MWEPDPSWEALAGGRGALSVGSWRARTEDGPWIVKRVRAPGPDEAPLADPRSPDYWRREAEVALAGATHPGLRLPVVRRVDEDDEGVTIWTEEVRGEAPPALFVVRALGRFAADTPPQAPWAARGLLRARLARFGAGGLRTLERTTVADLAVELWRRREGFLDRCAVAVAGPAHGDLVPANLVGTAGDDVIAIDWSGYGVAPVGADLGYYALSCREDFTVLLDGHLAALAEAGSVADPEEVAFVARVHAVFTVLARAEWALSRAAAGEGALAGKFRHPSVAPHLRALQRQFPQIEALLDL